MLSLLAKLVRIPLTIKVVYHDTTQHHFRKYHFTLYTVLNYLANKVLRNLYIIFINNEYDWGNT